MKLDLISTFWPIVVTSVGAIWFVSFLLKKRRKRAEISDGLRRDFCSIPGPQPSFIPFIGNSLQLLPIKNYIRVLSDWGKKYGPIFCVKGIGFNTVFLNSAPYVQALLKSTNLDHLNKYGKFYNLFKEAFPTGKGTFFAKSTIWKSHRKSLNKLMTCHHLVSYMPLLNKAGVQLVEATEKQFSDGFHNEILDTVSVALFYTILEMSTGLDLYGTQIGIESHQDFKTFLAQIAKRIVQPWLIPEIIWKLHPSSKLQTKAIKRINKNFDSIIGKYNENVAAKSKPFVSILSELKMQGVSQDVIRDELLIMIIAGHDTSSFAVTMTCLLLALHPEHQEKCFQEITAICNVGGPHSIEFELSFDDLSALKYLEWCIFEAMRLFPPAVGYARELHSPLKLDDKLELPRGTNVIVSPVLLHKNEEYFPNPEMFDPLRFSPEECAKRHSYSYLPFSAGSRNCYGYKFAMMQTKVAVAYLLRYFVITTNETIDSVGMLPNVVMTPERNHLFKFDKRSM